MCRFLTSVVLVRQSRRQQRRSTEAPPSCGGASISSSGPHAAGWAYISEPGVVSVSPVSSSVFRPERIIGQPP
jgi:hypothetical protein